MRSSTIVENTAENVKKGYECNSDYYKDRQKELRKYLDRQDKHMGLSYHAVICAIEHEWNLSNYAMKTMLALVCDSNHNNLGMAIAGSSDNGATQAYIRLLKKLHNNGLHIDHLYALLTEKNITGNTLGNKIARFCDDETVRQYFEVLMYLKEHGISTRQLFNLISIKSDDKWHNGHYIVKNQKPETAMMFLTLLTSFLTDGISAQEIFDYLSVELKDKWTLSHQIARYQDANTIIQYFHLLKVLKKSGIDHDLINNHLASKNKHSSTMYDIIFWNQKNKDLYQLICKKEFVGIEGNLCLGKQKERIFDYINTLPFQEKIKALKNAIKPSHPLHDFFSIQRGLYKTRLDAGMFAKIKMTLDVCNKLLNSNIDKKNIERLTKERINLLTPIDLPTSTRPTFDGSSINVQINAANSLYPIYIGHEQFQNPAGTTPVMASVADIERHFNFPIPTAPSILNSVPVIRDISPGLVATKSLPEVATPITLAPVFVPPAAKTISTSAAAMYAPKPAIKKDAPVVVEEKRKEKRQAVLA